LGPLALPSPPLNALYIFPLDVRFMNPPPFFCLRFLDYGSLSSGTPKDAPMVGTLPLLFGLHTPPSNVLAAGWRYFFRPAPFSLPFIFVDYFDGGCVSSFRLPLFCHFPHFSGMGMTFFYCSQCDFSSSFILSLEHRNLDVWSPPPPPPQKAGTFFFCLFVTSRYPSRFSRFPFFQ